MNRVKRGRGGRYTPPKDSLQEKITLLQDERFRLERQVVIQRDEIRALNDSLDRMKAQLSQALSGAVLNQRRLDDMRNLTSGAFGCTVTGMRAILTLEAKRPSLNAPLDGGLATREHLRRAAPAITQGVRMEMERLHRMLAELYPTLCFSTQVEWTLVEPSLSEG